MIRIRIIWARALGILLPSIHHTDTVASLHAEIKWNLHPFSAFLRRWSLRFTGLVPHGDVCDSQSAGWVWSYRLGGRLERIMLHQPARTMARRWRGCIEPHASTRSGLQLNTDFHSVGMNLGIVSLMDSVFPMNLINASICVFLHLSLCGAVRMGWVNTTHCLSADLSVFFLSFDPSPISLFSIYSGHSFIYPKVAVSRSIISLLDLQCRHLLLLPGSVPCTAPVDKDFKAYCARREAWRQQCSPLFCRILQS